MKFVRINAVGVELEGGWKKLPPHPIGKDLSVRPVDDLPHYGEVTSPPLKSWEDLVEFLTLNQPKGVNASCGYHVHVSTRRKADYARLMNRTFYTLLRTNLRAWGETNKWANNHPFMLRLAGKWITPHNRRNYCRKDFIPEKQLGELKKTDDGGARHCILNYCYEMHGTLECRVFPGFTDLNHYIGGAKVFLETVESYLQKRSKEFVEQRNAVFILGGRRKRCV